jgi:hypothetical protein
MEQIVKDSVVLQTIEGGELRVRNPSDVVAVADSDKHWYVNDCGKRYKGKACVVSFSGGARDIVQGTAAEVDALLRRC